MLTVRRAAERGHANHGWLDSYHTFSFANYYDPKFMGFGALRVINDDTVAAAAGFAPHSHKDMEIISYVLTGALEHKDSLGNGSVIRPGEVQLMSAGSGVTHSEYNASPHESVHFLQIWIQPGQNRLPPGYEQKFFSNERKRARLCLLASSDSAEGSMRIHQEALVFATLLESGETVSHTFARGHKGWVQIARGQANVADITLQAGDGIAIENEERISISSHEAGELLLFDLAA